MFESKKSGMRLAFESIANGNIASYEYSLMVPPDPCSGSNAHTELNPKSVEYLLDAAKSLEAARPDVFAALYPKDPKLATYKFLTKVGYHGAVNGVGVVPTYEGIEDTPEAGKVKLDSVFSKWMEYFKEQFAVMRDEVQSVITPVETPVGVVSTGTTQPAPELESKNLSEVSRELFKDLDVRTAKKEFNNVPEVSLESLKDPEANSEFWASLWVAAHEQALRKSAVSLSTEGLLDNVYRWIGNELKRVSRTAELPKLGGGVLLKNVLETAGNQFTQEGLFDFLFGKGSSPKDEPPSMKRLEVLEEKAKKLTNPAAIALLEGKSQPSQELIDRLMAFTDDHVAPSMVFKQNRPLFEILIKLVKLPKVNPESVAEKITDAKTKDEVKRICEDYINKMVPQCKLMDSAKKLVVGKANPKELYADLTNNYQHNWEFVRSYTYKDVKYPQSHEAASLAQYFGWPLGSLENEEGEGLEALIEQEPKLYDEYLDKFDEINESCRAFEDIFSCGAARDYYSFSPVRDETQFLIHGRCWLIEEALKLKVSNEELTDTQPQGDKMEQEIVPPAQSVHPVFYHGMAMEGLFQHRLDATSEENDSRQTELAKLTSDLADKFVWADKLSSLCAEGILANIGNIRDIVSRSVSSATGSGLEQVCNLDDYRETLEGFCATPRFHWLVCQYKDNSVQRAAGSFLIELKERGLVDLVKSKDLTSLEPALSALAATEWEEISKSLPLAVEYSEDSIREYLDTLAKNSVSKQASPVRLESLAVCVSDGEIDSLVSGSFDQLPDLDFMDLRSLFASEKYLAGDQLVAVKKVAQLALKAVAVLEVIDTDIRGVINEIKVRNAEYTRKILNYVSSAAGATSGTETMSQEEIAFASGVPDVLAGHKQLKEAQFLSFFGFGKKDRNTKVRETSKDSQEWRIAGLLAEQQEFLNKALGQFGGSIPELKELCYVGYANQGKLYNDIAKRAGLAHYDHAKDSAAYIKAAGGFTDYYLDYAIEVQQRNSKLRKLVEQTIHFSQEAGKGETPATIIDAFNNRGSSEATVIAQQYSKRFVTLQAVSGYRGISSAKDVLKPKYHYDVVTLEEQAMAYDDFEKNLGECTLQNVFTAYNKLCYHLQCADALSEYLMSRNRDLGIAFAGVRDTLWAMADVLAWVMYSNNALYASACNLMATRIWFLERLTDGKYSAEGLFDFLKGKQSPKVEPQTEHDQSDEESELGLGELYDLVDDWLYATHNKGGEPDPAKLAKEHYDIPSKLLARPFKNRKAIQSWFTANNPEALPSLNGLFKRMENQDFAEDTAFLLAWNHQPNHALMQRWAELAQKLAPVLSGQGSENDRKTFAKIWAASGITQVVKSFIDDELEGYPYTDLVDKFVHGARPPVAEVYEEAAVGNNCIYAKVCGLSIWRKWAEEAVEGDDLLVLRLLSKTQDKLINPSLEWTSVLATLFSYGVQIGRLSSRSA